MCVCVCVHVCCEESVLYLFINKILKAFCSANFIGKFLLLNLGL